MGDENIFLLFPKELWEMILDRVEDSKDVLQVFKAYPELDLAFENKKRVWLVGQVIRILINRFALKDWNILKCRLVCKQWKMRVDSVLESQSVFRAYHHELDKEEKDYWQAFDHWNILGDLDGLYPEYRYSDFLPKKFFGGVVFNIDFTNFAEFLEDMKSCPPHQNPFVGRILTITFVNEKSTPEGGPRNNVTTFWSSCFQVLEKYGQHLFHLNLYIGNPTNQRKGLIPPLGIWNTILQVLARAPNLKSVKLVGWESWGKDELLHPSLNLATEPPSLPLLECLYFPCFFLMSDELINPILTSVGSQLRKLEMPVGYWRKGMEGLFKYLTELELNFIEQGQPDGAEVPISHTPKNLIPSIVASNLAKLSVSCNDNDELGVEVEIFKWFRRFPALKHLSIGSVFTELYIKEANRCQSEEKLERFPSLEYLCIRDSGRLSFNFRRAFPSLRELKMFIRAEPLVTDLSIPDLQIKLREELQTLKIYDSNIWEHLPKLTRVILYETDLGTNTGIEETYKFSRDGYEKTRRMRQDQDKANQNEFNELRKHMQWYLEMPEMEEDSGSESSGSSTTGGSDDDGD